MSTTTFLGCIIGILYNTQITFATNSSYATISPDYYKMVVDLFLPSDYVLSQNIYDWNVSEIVYYINTQDPELLYIIDTSYLVQVFPEHFLRQLPRDILISHQLYYLLPSNDTLSHNATSPQNISTPSSACLYPFVETRHDSYFKWEFEDLNVSFECGLLCEYGDVLYGIRPEQQQTTDRFLYICSIIFFITLIMVSVNQCMDSRFTTDSEPCCHRGFLYHAPICISGIYAVFVACLFLPFVVDKENIVCAEDIDDNHTLSLSNPGGSTVCTIVGCIFYTAMLLFGLYTFGFTFVLWRQFFAPLQSLWSKLRRLKICCACVCCLDGAILPILTPIIDYIDSRSRVKQILHLHNTPSQSPRQRTTSVIVHKVTCHDIFCSTTTWAHYILYVVAMTITAFAMSEDIIDAFSPIGICTVGGRDEQILRYTIVPFTTVLVGCSFFLPYAVYLLYQVTMHSSSQQNKKMMQRLGARILIYFICMEICFVIICKMAWVFYDQRDEIMSAAETRMFCLTYRASTGNVDQCYNGFALSISTFIEMALTMPIAGFSSLGLTCHIKNRKRWCILICILFDALRCKRYGHELSVLDRMKSTALEGKPKGIFTDSKKSPSSNAKAFTFPDFVSKTTQSTFVSKATQSTHTENPSSTLDVPVPEIPVGPSISSSDDIENTSEETTITHVDL